jgi:hypothetical protein
MSIRASLVAICAALLPLLPHAAHAQDAEPFLLGPPTDDGPVTVSVGLVINDINEIDETAQRFEFEGLLTLQWRDRRFAFDPESAGVREKIFQGRYQFDEVATGWWPQVVIANGSGPYERYGVMLRNRFDGTMTYVEEMNAWVEMRPELRQFPFDRERFEIVLHPLGLNRDEVVLSPSSDIGVPGHGISIAEWQLGDVSASARDHHATSAGRGQRALSAVVVTLELARRPGSMVRLVILPMMLLVGLSWSVFWMDRESLGDRMAISFIGILTVVAYQLTVSGMIPRIPYVTLLGGFIGVSFFTVSASVVVNLVVGHLDRSGRRARGDRIDYACRWAFPLAYGVLLATTAGYFFVRY